MDRHELAMRYVLGDLSEEEETALQSRYLSDENEFEELEIAEDELIDRHVRGKLPANDSTRFEEMLSHSPRLRERVEFARILAKRVSSEPSPLPVTELIQNTPSKKGIWRRILSWGGFGGTTGMAPALRYATPVVIMLILASVVAVVVWQKKQAESHRLAQEQERQQRERIEREAQAQANQSNGQNQQQNTNAGSQQQNANAGSHPQQPEQPRPRQRQTIASVFPVYLVPSTSTRGSGTQSKPYQIEQSVRSVQLNLNVESDRKYPSYNASLADANFRPITQESNLKPFQYKGRKYIQLQVARDNLTDGLYNVHVEGVTASGQIENFADYPLRVRAR